MGPAHPIHRREQPFARASNIKRPSLCTIICQSQATTIPRSVVFEFDKLGHYPNPQTFRQWFSFAITDASIISRGEGGETLPPHDFTQSIWIACGVHQALFVTAPR